MFEVFSASGFPWDGILIIFLLFAFYWRDKPVALIPTSNGALLFVFTGYVPRIARAGDDFVWLTLFFFFMGNIVFL